MGVQKKYFYYYFLSVWFFLSKKNNNNNRTNRGRYVLWDPRNSYESSSPERILRTQVQVDEIILIFFVWEIV